MISNIKILISFSFFFITNSFGLFAQPCSNDVIELNVNLSSNADSLWQYSGSELNGSCCNYNSNYKCIKFSVRINDNSKGVILNVFNGTNTVNSTFKILNNDLNLCQNETYNTGKILCLEPQTESVLIFCTTNVNLNKFSIKSISKNETPKVCLAETYAEGCKPFEVTFYDACATNAKKFIWDFGNGITSNDNIPFYTYEIPGNYKISLLIEYGNNCIDSSANDILVKVFPNAEITIIKYPETSDISAPEIQFNIQSDSIAQCLWLFGDGDSSNIFSPTHTYKDTGDFTVKVKTINSFGCDNFDEILVSIKSGNSFIIPNAFTPNKESSCEGKYKLEEHNNYVFYPIVKYVKHYNFEIYNRWGEKIFETKDINIGWDGYYKGNLCKQDVYIWRIEIVFENNYNLKKTGNVTLLR